MAKRGRLELRDNILQTLWSAFDHCDVIGEQGNRFQWRKCKIRAIMPFTVSMTVIQCYGGR